MSRADIWRELAKRMKDKRDKEAAIKAADHTKVDSWVAEKESWRTTPMTKEMAQINEIARRALHPEA